VPETIKVEILGRPITLKSAIELAHLKIIASLVDDKMREIRKALPAVSTEDVAIMAALNMAYEYLELKEDCRRLHQEIETKSTRLIQLIDSRSLLPLRWTWLSALLLSQ
jgi:cell division protein ZapA